MKTTSNLGLKKPEGTDIVDIADLNGNMDTLDTAVKDLQDRAAASVPLTQKGAASGVASLDASAKLPAGQLPSSAVQATTADVTYYVRTDGSDGNNGLANTAAGAFKTIGKAISMVPTIVNHTVTINVATGTYTESVRVVGFSGGGAIRFNPSVAAVSDSYIINDFLAARCSIPVNVYGFKAVSTTVNAFAAAESINVQLYYCKSDSNTTASGAGGIVANSAKLYAYSCSISNKNMAIVAGQNAGIFSYDNTGSGSNVGLYAGEGGHIAATGSVPTGTTAQATGNSGTIDNRGVINPWGDNTYGLRPILWAHRSSDINLSSGAWNTLVYNAAPTNQNINYSTVTGSATINQTGWYNVKVSVLIFGMTDGQQGQLRVAHNNTYFRVVDFRMNPTTGANMFLSGSMNLFCGASDTVLIQLYMDGAHTIIGGDDQTRFEIIRLA